MKGSRTRTTQPKRIPASEAVLDAAVEYTFPASDPISVDHAFYAARQRERDADSIVATGKDDTMQRT